MYVVYARAPGGAVTQVSHIYLSDKRSRLGVGSFREFLGDSLMGVCENTADGIGALRPFAEDIFLPGRSVEFHAAYACGFLSSVMLLLHDQIEFVETIERRTVFFLVI